MRFALASAFALTALAPAAFAGEQNEFQTRIQYSPAALSNSVTAAAELNSIEAQARNACRYRSESVLSPGVDRSCVKSIMDNLLGRDGAKAVTELAAPAAQEG